MKNVVVVPIYRHPTGTEKCALRQCAAVFHRQDICIIYPHSLDIKNDLALYPHLRSVALDDRWFAGVEGYNFMMLSPDFYQIFSKYDYMLIYQLDAYVFEDQLDEWASKGYDYIGAPWMPNTNFFQLTIGSLIRRLRNALSPAGTTERVTHAQLAYSVGNGGFSLRRIAKMEEVTRRFASEISRLRFGEKKAQEDVFLSVYIRKRAGILVPGWREALRFAWENNPQYSMKKNGGVLPFGCHGWSRGGAWDEFWKAYIER